MQQTWLKYVARTNVATFRVAHVQTKAFTAQYQCCQKHLAKLRTEIPPRPIRKYVLKRLKITYGYVLQHFFFFFKLKSVGSKLQTLVENKDII